ncbi:hypothetical protein P3W45_001064 [Vairimorpha bombi]|jgi:hypothetical protein
MYLPRVFKKNIEKEQTNIEETPILEREAVIPENTLYEESLVLHKRPNKRHITVFGFTHKNLESVIKKIKEVSQVEHIEYGKNWINVICLSGGNELLKLNKGHINGEIIGVFRDSSNVIVEDKDIFLKREGFINKVIAYFFGE